MAALNIYSTRAHGFTGDDIARAELFGKESAKTLRLELHLARLQEAKDNLAAALKNRTAIDVAVGIIRVQNRARTRPCKFCKKPPTHATPNPGT